MEDNKTTKLYNLVYGIFFAKKENCKNVYIGETKRMLKQCLADHCGYVTNNVTSTPTGEHFNLPGHTLATFPHLGLNKEQGRKLNIERRENPIA